MIPGYHKPSARVSCRFCETRQVESNISFISFFTHVLRLLDMIDLLVTCSPCLWLAYAASVSISSQAQR